MSTPQYRDSGEGSPKNDLSVDTDQRLRRLFENVYSEGDLSVVEELVTPTFTGRCAGMGKTVEGVSGLKAHAARLRSTFAGLNIEIDVLRRTPDGFAVYLTANGRFERAFSGIQPTCVIGPAGEEPHGPRVTVSGVVTGTMGDGRISEWELDWDFKALRAQNSCPDAQSNRDRPAQWS